MSCKKKNTCGGKGDAVIWPCIKFIFYLPSLSLLRERGIFFFLDLQFDKNSFYYYHL